MLLPPRHLGLHTTPHFHVLGPIRLRCVRRTIRFALPTTPLDPLQLHVIFLVTVVVLDEKRVASHIHTPHTSAVQIRITHGAPVSFEVHLDFEPGLDRIPGLGPRKPRPLHGRRRVAR